jgi:hypothetical protein
MRWTFFFLLGLIIRIVQVLKSREIGHHFSKNLWVSNELKNNENVSSFDEKLNGFNTQLNKCIKISCLCSHKFSGVSFLV